MFKDLRQNTPFYILYRGEKPTLETGQVVGVSQPMPKAQTQYNAMYPQQPEFVVDVRVKVGANTLTFEKLPANNAIADFSASQQNVVVSSNRDAIKSEVEAMLSQSKGIIGSVSYHESVVRECDLILKNLNPAYAKEKEQEAEIKELNVKISELEKKLSGIDEIKELLSAQTSKNNKSHESKNN